jgi:hypothetical protein
MKLAPALAGRLTVPAALIVILNVSSADACSCMDPGPVCQAYWRTAAVFDGTVRGIDRTSRDESIASRTTHQLPELIVKLDVDRGWKGVDAGLVEVVTNEPDVGSCGFDFKIGHRYLVFARGASDRLVVSRCSLTREFNGTGDGADFLASLSKPATGGRAFGSIELSIKSFRPEGPSLTRRPMNIPVRLMGGGRTLTTTARAGRYEFFNVMPGQYEIRIALPKGYTTWKPSRSVDISNPRACVRENFAVSPGGRITGQLVGSNRRSLANVHVELTGADAARELTECPGASARVEPDGFFELQGLPPGRYIVGINLRDLPSKWNPYPRYVYPGPGSPPRIIELSLGQLADLGQWKLPPPLASVQLHGVVVWKDGTPASGIYVNAWDVTRNPVGRARGAGGALSGADGRFVIEVLDSRAYTFMARAAGNGPSLPVASPRIEARPGLAPVRIVITHEEALGDRRGRNFSAVLDGLEDDREARERGAPRLGRKLVTSWCVATIARFGRSVSACALSRHTVWALTPCEGQEGIFLRNFFARVSNVLSQLIWRSVPVRK